MDQSNKLSAVVLTVERRLLGGQGRKEQTSRAFVLSPATPQASPNIISGWDGPTITVVVLRASIVLVATHVAAGLPLDVHDRLG